MDQVSLPSDFLNEEELSEAKMETILAPEVQDCWNTCLPIPFERASSKSWWDPKFDSNVLEEQFKISSNAHVCLKFRYALWYMLLVFLTWFYFLVSRSTGHYYEPSLHILTIICIVGSICISYTKFFNRYMLQISMFMAIFLAIFSLAFLSIGQLNAQLPLGYYAVCLQVLILIYTLFPLKMYMCIIIGVLFSVTFEVSNNLLSESDGNTHRHTTSEKTFIKLITHLAIHIVGLHIFLMTNVRMRNTFMKVGFSLLVRRQLELEKKLKENMIYSLIPKSVVENLKKDNETSARRRSSQDTGNDIKNIFRPFNMSSKDKVSILFADICGFTKISGNKSAEELVDILNNLFQRFDRLCKQNNCEKISTLGDCYYCISGCPEDDDNHAKNCVEMGLQMVEAIKEFDNEKNQGINMRVGIHTGMVLFGIVGTRRFKFDVWSNDVTFANRMESTGKPGMVHISEKTMEFVENFYYTEEGEPYMGLKTYFILCRKNTRMPSYSGSFRAEGRQNYTNSLHLYVTTPIDNNSLSPMSNSLSPQTRPRVLSYDTSTSLNKPICPSYNPNLLSPNSCKMKANSLPSILDTENEQNQDNVKENVGRDQNLPGSSKVKYTVKLKNWKIPKFKRKTSDQKNDEPEIVIDGGYQQVPTIIESANPRKKESFISVTEPEPDDPINNMDMKSYISQSRSDMIGMFDYNPCHSDFVRGGSYRSQYGRTLNNDLFLHRANSNRSRRGRSPSQFEPNFEPTERARSATIVLASGNFTFNRPMQKRSLDVSSKLSSAPIFDETSITNSRKDSGIKSNSRRSSIQQLDSTPNNSDLLQNRVSGYYTSSQSTMNTPVDNAKQTNQLQSFVNQNLRKQSDRQLIKCVQDNSKSKSNYFLKPPLSRFSLFFKNRNLELDYRQKVHALDSEGSNGTLSNSKINTYLDVFISSLIFIFVSLGIMMLYGVTTCWIISVLLLLLLQITGSYLCLNNVDRIRFLSNFFRWNLYGSILICLPILLTIVNFVNDRLWSYDHLHLYTYLLFISLIHFCNFTQVNCWVKNFMAIIFCLLFAAVLFNNFATTGTANNLRTKRDVNLLDSEYLNETFIVDESSPIVTNNTRTSEEQYHNLIPELIINLALLLVLVFFLNREFEIGYRLSFHANHVSQRDKTNVQILKDQADYLIYNIVPQHVAEKLKKDAKYSENFKNVAIIFASVVNFNEMYDESFADGIEYLRILNELIADFDELLDCTEFESVEKIKTIGSTYMAASGLNSELRNRQMEENQHLYDLMEFALQMQEVVRNFNTNLLQFELKLRIGYNIGDVTAAVIGNTKLYYDIWGDSVNIASRMDSTGVDDHIQVGERCLEFLENKYDFEARGSIYVKGKDNMNCFLLRKRKTPDLLCVPKT